LVCGRSVKYRSWSVVKGGAWERGGAFLPLILQAAVTVEERDVQAAIVVVIDGSADGAGGGGGRQGLGPISGKKTVMRWWNLFETGICFVLVGKKMTGAPSTKRAAAK